MAKNKKKLRQPQPKQPPTEKELIWRDFQKVWMQAHPEKIRQEAQKEAGEYLKKISYDKLMINAKVQQLEAKIKMSQATSATVMKESLAKMFRPCPKRSTVVLDPVPTEEPQTEQSVVSVEPVASDEEEPINNLSKAKTPAQQRVAEEIKKLNEEMTQLVNDSGLLEDNSSAKYKLLSKNKKKAELNLKRLQRNVKLSSKQRAKTREALRIILADPEMSAKIPDKLKLKENPGRPPLEDEYPQLLQTIRDIAIHNSAADDRRRSETMKICSTLDQLTQELIKRGYELSRTATYYRLLPKSSRTTDGKRHIRTVPVRLAKASNNLRKPHEDSRFAASTIRDLYDLAEFMGQEVVAVISQDDKARVPLGLAAATLQSPIIMSMEYKVMLPDHNFPVAKRHTLIPSVYGGLQFKDSKISYSGPTYIAIRSGKHDKSTAKSHSDDLNRLLELENFASLLYQESGGIKPIFILLVDGGPDENPRFQKTLNRAAENFKKFNLDCMFVATNAPHHSAFNPVERRMAPLSRDLAGIILDHQKCGSHLNTNGETIDCERERLNFHHAGASLAEVWNNNIIDGFDVSAEYIPPPDPPQEAQAESTGKLDEQSGRPPFLTEEWKKDHVLQSQYFLQIIKCGDTSCCSPVRSTIKTILPGFLPPPILIKTTVLGPQAATQEEHGKADVHFAKLFQRLSFSHFGPFPKEFQPNHLPYDYYCPKIRNELEQRYCKRCYYYTASSSSMKQHLLKLRHSDKSLFIVNTVGADDEGDFDLVLDPTVDAQIIRNMEEWVAPIFVQVLPGDVDVSQLT